MMAISRVKMRPVDPQSQLPLASREQTVVQVLVGRWASLGRPYVRKISDITDRWWS